MPEEVAQGVFQIVVPLPRSPLKAINSYVFLDKERPLIVDTGMNQPECKKALQEGFEALKVDPHDCDFFITHMHSDHMGLVNFFAGPDSKVYFNAIEAEMIDSARARGGFGTRLMGFGKTAGFSEKQIEETFVDHPGNSFQFDADYTMEILDEGDEVRVGEYAFKVIQTPGHSPGHLCLYDAAAKLMVCGDHVLNQISPNISAWDDDQRPLGDFLDSLAKVRDYAIDLALPGHRTLITDFAGRVDELLHHHELRLHEIQGILAGAPLNAYQVASKMKWDLKVKGWNEFPPMQKWFATGEALAHIQHLQGQGLVTSKMHNDITTYMQPA